MNKNNIIYGTLAVIIIALLIFTGGYYTGYKSNTEITVTKQTDTIYQPKEVEKIKLDTVTKKQTVYQRDYYRDSIYIDRIKIDSFYCDMPYIDKFDTVTKANDSIRFEYHYPQRIITSLMVQPHKDTIPVIVNKIETVVKKESRPIIYDVFTHAAAFIFGYLIR